MTAWVADYVSRIPPADLKAAGVVGVCRYLADTTTIGKIIGQAEYDELRAAGIAVLLNWEQASSDWLGGAAKGAAHAASAARQARALGYPAGSVIVGSADFDMSAGQWTSYGQAYATAFRDGLAAAGFGAGVYGPYDVLTRVEALGGFRVFWQAGMSTAWSGGRNASLWPGAHLRQRRHVTVGGHDTDYNDIAQTDWQGIDDMSVDDVRTGIAEMFDEAATRLTPTGRNLGNDLNTIIDARLKPLADALSALAAKPTATVDVDAVAEAVTAKLRTELEAAAEAAVRRVLGAVDGATPQGS